MQDHTAGKQWKQSRCACSHITAALPLPPDYLLLGPPPSSCPWSGCMWCLKIQKQPGPSLSLWRRSRAVVYMLRSQNISSHFSNRQTVLQNVTVFHTTVTTGKCISLSGSEDAGEMKASCQKCPPSFQTTTPTSICREQHVRPSGHLTHCLYSSLRISQRRN